jgi:choline transport protein
MTGWNSIVIAWLLGLLQSAFAFLGFDLIYHISEEMPNPSIHAPKAVNSTIAVSAVSGMAVLLAILFCIPDLESVLSTSYK